MNTEDIIKAAMMQSLNENNVEDGLEIIKNKTEKDKTINYEDIKVYKKNKIRNKDVSFWVSADFVSYTREIYNKKYNQDWILNYRMQCNAILKIKDKLLDTFGYCNNSLLKKYIDWFFEYYISKIFDKNKNFYFNQMLQYDPLNEFYINKDNVEYNEKKKKERIGKLSLDMSVETIDAIILLSEKRFLYDYGIVIFFNYFLIKKNMKEIEIINKMSKMINDIKDTINYEKLFELTDRNSPYPINFKNKFLDEFLEEENGKRLENNTINIIEYSDNTKLQIKW